MKAELIEPKLFQEFKNLKKILLSPKDYQHLIKVSRSKVGEKVLLLNGIGGSIETMIQNIGKNEFELKVLNIVEKERDYRIDLFLGIPKKDTLEEAVDFATQLGIERVLLFESEYSQKLKTDFVKLKDRLNKISVSSLKQSNNLFLPNIIFLNKDFENELKNNKYEHQFLMTLDKSGASKIEKPLSRKSRYLFFIGPEGGFSESEELHIKSYENSISCHLPCPILRVVPAISTTFGFLISQLKD